jgi:hypothetical protein
LGVIDQVASGCLQTCHDEDRYLGNFGFVLEMKVVVISGSHLLFDVVLVECQCLSGNVFEVEVVGDRVHANARFIHTLLDADAGIARFTTQAGQVAARSSYRMSGACYRRTDVVSWPSIFPEANPAQMLIHKPRGCPRSFFSGNCGRVSTVARVISLFRSRSLFKSGRHAARAPSEASRRLLAGTLRRSCRRP